jgi:hypothetical protein
LFIGVGFTLRSNTHRVVKVLGMREGPVLLHVEAHVRNFVSAMAEVRVLPTVSAERDFLVT